MKINKLVEEAENFIKVMANIQRTIGHTTFHMTQAKICEELTKRLMEKYSTDEIFTILFITDAYQDN